MYMSIAHGSPAPSANYRWDQFALFSGVSNQCVRCAFASSSARLLWLRVQVHLYKQSHSTSSSILKSSSEKDGMCPFVCPSQKERQRVLSWAYHEVRGVPSSSSVFLCRDQTCRSCHKHKMTLLSLAVNLGLSVPSTSAFIER